MLLFATLLFLTSAQQYCRCSGGFVYDPLRECLHAGDYGVENSCYTCPVTNASGTFYFCGSARAQGFLCITPGSLAVRQAACVALGGNPSSSEFRCVDSAGANKSQACTGVTAAPTEAPTSDAASLTPYGALMTVGLLLFCYATQ